MEYEYILAAIKQKPNTVEKVKITMLIKTELEKYQK